MSLLALKQSECIEKILDDYNENVSSEEKVVIIEGEEYREEVVSEKDYCLWSSMKYIELTKLSKNSKNSKDSEFVDKALNFVMYLDPVSLVDKRLKSETQWDEFKEWDRRDIKRSMIEEFDPEGREKKRIISERNKGIKSWSG